MNSNFTLTPGYLTPTYNQVLILRGNYAYNNNVLYYFYIRFLFHPQQNFAGHTTINIIDNNNIFSLVFSLHFTLLYDLTCAPSFNSSVCPTGTWLSSVVHIELSMAWNTLFSPGNLDRWISLIWLTFSLWVQSFVANIPSCSITWFFVLFNFWTSASGQLKN